MSLPLFDAHRTQVAGAFLGPFHTLALDYDGSNNLIYVGWALPGSGGSKALPIWRIVKLLYAGSNLTDVQWPAGNTDFRHIWNNRTLLTYS